MKKLLLLLFFLLLIPLATLNVASQPNEWVLVGYGRDYVNYTNGQAIRLIIGRPNVYDFRSGEWVPFLLYQDGNSYVLRTGLCTVRVFLEYAVYYDPNMSETRINRAEWSIEYEKSWGKWIPIAWETSSISTGSNSTCAWITITKTAQEGTMEIWIYGFWGGGLKHTVKFTSNLDGITKFRLIWRQEGIPAFKLSRKEVTDTRIKRSEGVILSKTKFNATLLEFHRENRAILRINLEKARHKLKSVEVVPVASSVKLIQEFGTWSLGLFESFELDPTYETTLSPTDDAYCDGANPSTNYGSSTDMIAGDYADPYNATIRFDVSSIPSDATITQALLCLYSHGQNYWTAGIDFLEIHRITSSWDESTITYNTFPSYSDPVYRKLNATTGWNTWDIKEIVQGWVNGSYANYGVYIGRDFTNSGDGSGWHIFYSKESGHTEFHPQLNVTYTTNIPPSKPSLASPSPNGTIISVVNPWLNCTFTDPNGDAMNLSFYWSNDTLIGTLTNVANGTTTGIQATVSRGQTYYWYVNVSDGEGTTQSDLFSFYVNYLPTISFSRATPFSVRRAEVVGLEFAASDNETATENLTVTIQIKDLTGTIVSSGTASYDSTYDVFIYTWTVPQEAQLGYYTAIGTVQDGDGGTATTTKEQAFEVIGPGGAPAGGPGGSSSRTQSVTTPAPTETPTPPFPEEREEFEALLYEYRYPIGVILLAFLLGLGGGKKR